MTALLVPLLLVAAASGATFIVATRTAENDHIGVRVVIVWIMAMVIAAALLVASGPKPCTDPYNPECAATFKEGHS